MEQAYIIGHSQETKTSAKQHQKSLKHFNYRVRLYMGWCCDRKSRAAYAQSFALWQQATIEFTCHDHSIIACSRHICMVWFFTHIPFVVNHTINATPPERLQQHPLLFTTNRTDRTFFVWRLNSARPSHPRHSTILLRSEMRKASHCGSKRQ